MLVLMLAFFLIALSSAQFFVVQKNTRQSAFFTTHSQLRHYADSGVRLAIHDLRGSISGNLGKIGTLGWTTLNDVGRDGLAATGDFGEGDGMPTPGEPNLVPASMGPGNGINLVVYTEDCAYPDIKHIVATTYNAESHATVECFAKATPLSVPKTGAVYMDPEVALELKGNAFTIDGNDLNPDGTPGTDDPKYGIVTTEGSPAGDNAATISDQIDSGVEDQVTGYGPDPSCGEMAGLPSIESLFDQMAGVVTNPVAPGTHSSPTMGTEAAMEITMVDGDLHLTGDGSGAGVLLVNGNMTMSGLFQFYGVVIVRGDVRQTGGGSETHIYGSLLVQETFTVVDENELTVTGTADVFYCSAAIDAVNDLIGKIGAAYNVLYWDYLN